MTAGRSEDIILPNIHKKLNTAGVVLHQRGWFRLLKASVRFLIRPIYQRDLYFLFEYDITKSKRVKTSAVAFRDYYLTFKVVSSNEEADKLETDGYEFRSYPTKYNDNLKTYRIWLDCGATAFCAFMGKFLAGIFWVIPTQSAQDRIGTLPVRVGYPNHEVLLRGAWTNPNYRGLEPFNFTARNLILTTRNLYRFLQEAGVTKVKSPVEYSNTVGQRLTGAMGFRKYAKARYMKILFWKFWKETYLDKP